MHLNITCLMYMLQWNAIDPNSGQNWFCFQCKSRLDHVSDTTRRANDLICSAGLIHPKIPPRDGSTVQDIRHPVQQVSKHTVISVDISVSTISSRFATLFCITLLWFKIVSCPRTAENSAAALFLNWERSLLN